MQKLIYWSFIGAFIFSSCAKENPSTSSFEVFCEMIANDAKPLALSAPMEPQEMDKVWTDFQRVADEYQVQIFREDDFPVTMLFPATVTDGKSVAVIYKGHRLTQYKQLREDVMNSSGARPTELEALARRFGRLLGYGSQGTNLLLSKNSHYQSLSSFNVAQQITHLYYDNLDEAIDFYAETLRLNKVGPAVFQISEDAFIELHPLDGEHPKGQAKSTAIALLTDQLSEWYTYVKDKDVPIKYTYKPRDGGPHDGFVAIDPGGYLLEFEQFKQHPENELFMATLAQAPKVETGVESLNFYGAITWTYHNDLLKMQKFYEEMLGYSLVADQGWTKIYQASNTGFIGLVDERRGMEDYADTKAVEIEWKLSEASSFDRYASQYWQEYGYNNNYFIGPEKYRYFVSSSE